MTNDPTLNPAAGSDDPGEAYAAALDAATDAITAVAVRGEADARQHLISAEHADLGELCGILDNFDRQLHQIFGDAALTEAVTTANREFIAYLRTEMSSVGSIHGGPFDRLVEAWQKATSELTDALR